MSPYINTYLQHLAYGHLVVHAAVLLALLRSLLLLIASLVVVWFVHQDQACNKHRESIGPGGITKW